MSHRHSRGRECFCTEESSRFNYATVGRKLLSGKITADSLQKMVDGEGISLFEAMKARGFDPNNISESKKRLRNAKAMIELHIEQGPVLENAGVAVGVVTAIAAPTRMKVKITGQFDHSGACPMWLRKDALAAAAEIILAVE